MKKNRVKVGMHVGSDSLDARSGLSGRKDNSQKYMEATMMNESTKSFEEIAEGFRAMGVDVSDEVVRQCHKNFDSLPKEIQSEAEGLEQDIFATELMLGAESQPISGKLYCFSVEVEDISCMAEVFFDGVTSISGGAFEITDIEKEAVTPEMEESGVYQQKISYRVNGTKYEYDASIQYDWFDVGVISALNEALASERLDKRLFGDCSSDIMMISYCTKEWAEEFNEKTGFDLH